MHVYLYIHNKYTQHTHTLCTQKLLLWIQLITINHCPALKIINFFTPTFHNPINSQCTKSPTFQFILIKQPVSLRNAPSYRTKISCAPISFWFQITTSLKSSRSSFVQSIRLEKSNSWCMTVVPEMPFPRLDSATDSRTHPFTSMSLETVILMTAFINLLGLSSGP